MQNPLGIVHKKLTDVMWNFIVSGIIMVILAALIVWTPAILQLLVGLFVLLVAYCFFYAAYKIHSIRNHID